MQANIGLNYKHKQKKSCRIFPNYQEYQSRVILSGRQKKDLPRNASKLGSNHTQARRHFIPKICLKSIWLPYPVWTLKADFRYQTHSEVQLGTARRSESGRRGPSSAGTTGKTSGRDWLDARRAGGCLYPIYGHKIILKRKTCEDIGNTAI